MGDQIRYIRKSLGLKGMGYARILGITAEEVSRWENCKAQPSSAADRLMRLHYLCSQGSRLPMELNAWLLGLENRALQSGSIHLHWDGHAWR